MLYWDPNPVAFHIPYFDLPVFIYGICFVLGFYLGYQILLRLMRATLKSNERAQECVDRLTWYVVIGTIVGARLGHVFFYDWERYKQHPWQILNTREGGLASHGGTVGVLLALAFFYFTYLKRKTQVTFLELLDRMAIPTAVTATFIRIGNFFNQEIIGVPTNLPWAVTFGHPADGEAPVPRHPAQLYEAVLYFATFLILYFLWKRTSIKERPGATIGLFFILVFGGRFLIEFIKVVQESIFDQQLLQAGQWLSIPFILGGLGLLLWSKKGQTCNSCQK